MTEFLEKVDRISATAKASMTKAMVDSYPLVQYMNTIVSHFLQISTAEVAAGLLPNFITMLNGLGPDVASRFIIQAS